MKKVCLVLGAGRGIGATVAEKFALEGFHSHLCRRSDSDALQESLDQIQSKGGVATGELINAIDDGVIEKTIESIEKDIGPIEVLIYNLGAQSGMKLLDETSYKEFEWGWRMASLGLFRAAKTLSKVKGDNDDEQTGINIIERAVEEPIRQIVENAGMEGSVVVAKVLIIYSGVSSNNKIITNGDAKV